MILVLIVSLMAFYILQSLFYRNKVMQDIHYHVTLSHEEVFAGDIIWLYENLDYDGSISLPYVKVDSELPKGLYFLLEQEGGADACREGHVESVFILNGGSSIKRRWRVHCQTRGEYSLGSTMLVTGNLFGLKQISKRYTVDTSRENTLTVLPKTFDLMSVFTSSKMMLGDSTIHVGLYTAPFCRLGCREYKSFDSMNKINWKRSAAAGRLMVNTEEFSASKSTYVLLNLQSRALEKDPQIPSVLHYTEFNITTAASIFERMAEYDIPTALITNTFPTGLVPESEKGLYLSETFCGKEGMIELLRLLARLPLKLSVPFEKMLDIVAEKPEVYAPHGNLIIVTSFFNERMLQFYEIMKKQGITTAFYLTTTERSNMDIPDEVELFTVYRNFDN